MMEPPMEELRRTMGQLMDACVRCGNVIVRGRRLCTECHLDSIEARLVELGRKVERMEQ